MGCCDKWFYLGFGWVFRDGQQLGILFHLQLIHPLSFINSRARIPVLITTLILSEALHSASNPLS
jgi:hypothetical protein